MIPRFSPPRSSRTVLGRIAVLYPECSHYQVQPGQLFTNGRSRISISTRPQRTLKWMAMKKLRLHPACKLFPRLPKDELNALAADIAANGLRNSVVRYPKSPCRLQNRQGEAYIHRMGRHGQSRGMGHQRKSDSQTPFRQPTSGDCRRFVANVGAGGQGSPTIEPGQREKGSKIVGYLIRESQHRRRQDRQDQLHLRRNRQGD